MFYHKINESIIYSDESKNIINANPLNGNHAVWDSGTYSDVKNEIKSRLKIIQKSICPYCGLPMDDRDGRQIHIEHIAPKHLYPFQMLNIDNLVLSCAGCNMLKGTKNTVVLPQKNDYIDWEFWIVHPYFDNPIEHLTYDENGIVSELSVKGELTIRLFDLASVFLTIERLKILKLSEFGYDTEMLTRTVNYRRIVI